ncbi:energy-coupling factor ABC transporter permease [uncultured Formosa sp.]|uniref:energy-coupling factor ABC transporter permease n=1 Tax=uncultured Formosa sp. TaxID=255435 RepID=UPI002612478C|nr:energy-coupling factor ABC transporter permease [uncultured Formosa sp.]
MHIEPGIVDSAKIGLSYVTAAVAIMGVAKASFSNIKKTNPLTFLVKSVATTALVFTFFQVLPHYSVGVSEVHFILGSTLFLLFGLAPASIGLALGLLIQGAFFAPIDLPQYGMNVTTLLIPLMALSYVANKTITKDTPYIKLKYAQVLKLSLVYQAGIVGWVTFWAIYGQGIGVENLLSILSFGGAYMLVVLIEPLVDLGVLAIAKFSANRFHKTTFFEKRLYNAVQA